MGHSGRPVEGSAYLFHILLPRIPSFSPRIAVDSRGAFSGGPFSPRVDRMDTPATERHTNRNGRAAGRSPASRDVGRKALDALGPHVAAIQRLADTAADRDTADRAVDAARQQAADVVARARKDAAELIRAAETARRDARIAYRDVFAAAVTTGWTADQLEALGYDRVLLRLRRNRTAESADVCAEGAA